MKNISATITDYSDSRRDRILSLLESTGGWCSGESISALLGVSRAAVSKHVTALRALGHGIESAPRRGYRLLVKADCLSKESMAGLLTTKNFGKKTWQYLDETTSTNKIAALRAVDGEEEGGIVLAERQAAGRGKKGNAWHTPPRGIQLSAIFHPGIKDNITETLTMLGTVAVAEAVSNLCLLQPRIKAPNDVMINGRKVCGVLVEVGLLAGDAAWAVLGIGCNVNALPSDFPPNLAPLATSLLIESEKPVPRRELLAAILERVEFWYDYIQREEISKLKSRWACLQMADQSARQPSKQQ